MKVSKLPVLLPKSGQRFDFPRILPGEIIARPWFDTAIPAVVAGAVIITFVLLIPNALNVGNLYNMTQLYGEYLLVALGLTVVILAGGIDLSVGAVFALANLTTLLLLNYFQWPFYAAATAVIAISCGIGAVNGLLIGYLRLRAFLTTLAVLIIVRAVVDTLLLAYAIKISASSPVSPTWDFLSFKSVFGLPVSFYVAVLVAVVLHVTLTRSRFGWRLQAVGGARRSAFNAGVNVKRTVCLTYVISGGLSGVAGILYAARLANLGADAGLGMELLALTAVVLGGTSLGGGRGSVAKTVLGTVIVLVISTILIRLGLPGGASTLAVGITLLIAVAFDAKWSVFRSSRAGAVRIQPKRHAMSDFPPAESWNKAALAFSYVLNSAHCLPCGGDGGAIDVVSDSAGNIFFGNHGGEIVVLRAEGKGYRPAEVFVHIGGQIQGLNLASSGDMLACVAGMGLYRINSEGKSIRLTNEVNCGWASLGSTARILWPGAVTEASDNCIYFTEVSTKFDVDNAVLEDLEMAANGRLLCYDALNGATSVLATGLHSPKGICEAGDGESLLITESTLRRILRYYYVGSRRGQFELFSDDLPGHPAGISGTVSKGIVCALSAPRSPVFDLISRFPDLRRRMVEQVSRQDWLTPSSNTACVAMLGANGNVDKLLWEANGEVFSNIAAARMYSAGLIFCSPTTNWIGVVVSGTCGVSNSPAAPDETSKVRV